MKNQIIKLFLAIFISFVPTVSLYAAATGKRSYVQVALPKQSQEASVTSPAAGGRAPAQSSISTCPVEGAKAVDEVTKAVAAYNPFGESDPDCSMTQEVPSREQAVATKSRFKVDAQPFVPQKRQSYSAVMQDASSNHPSPQPGISRVVAPNCLPADPTKFFWVKDFQYLFLVHKDTRRMYTPESFGYRVCFDETRRLILVNARQQRMHLSTLGYVAPNVDSFGVSIEKIPLQEVVGRSYPAVRAVAQQSHIDLLNCGNADYCASTVARILNKGFTDDMFADASDDSDILDEDFEDEVVERVREVEKSVDKMPNEAFLPYESLIPESIVNSYAHQQPKRRYVRGIKPEDAALGEEVIPDEEIAQHRDKRIRSTQAFDITINQHPTTLIRIKLLEQEQRRQQQAEQEARQQELERQERERLEKVEQEAQSLIDLQNTTHQTLVESLLGNGGLFAQIENHIMNVWLKKQCTTLQNQVTRILEQPVTTDSITELQKVKQKSEALLHQVQEQSSRQAGLLVKESRQKTVQPSCKQEESSVRKPAQKTQGKVGKQGAGKNQKINLQEEQKAKRQQDLRAQKKLKNKNAIIELQQKSSALYELHKNQFSATLVPKGEAVICALSLLKNKEICEDEDVAQARGWHEKMVSYVGGLPKAASFATQMSAKPKKNNKQDLSEEDFNKLVEAAAADVKVKEEAGAQVIVQDVVGALFGGDFPLPPRGAFTSIALREQDHDTLARQRQLRIEIAHNRMLMKRGRPFKIKAITDAAQLSINRLESLYYAVAKLQEFLKNKILASLVPEDTFIRMSLHEICVLYGQYQSSLYSLYGGCNFSTRLMFTHMAMTYTEHYPQCRLLQKTVTELCLTLKQLEGERVGTYTRHFVSIYEMVEEL